MPISYLRNALIYYELYNIEVDLNEKFKEEIDVLTDVVIEEQRERAKAESGRDTYKTIAIAVGSILLARLSIDAAVQIFK